MSFFVQLDMKSYANNELLYIEDFNIRIELRIF